jgi:hypothetical protein
VTEQTKAGTAAPAVGAGHLPSRHLASLRGGLRAALFRPASGSVSWRQIAGGAAFLIMGAAVSLARTRGPGALNTIWIEDAGNFLQDALHKSVLTTLTTQMNGYYDLVPRAVTAVAVAFPLQWAPGIMAACAALQYAMFGLIAYIASGPHLRSRWLRLLVAAPACVVPLGYTQANNDLATVQFIALYGTFWLLLWLPAARAGRMVSPLVMLGVTFSSILPVVFAPLVAARVIADRSKNTVAVSVCWAAGLAAQWSVQLRGLSSRPADWYTSPLWILRNYVTRAVPRAIFGESALGGSGTNAEGMPAPLRIASMGVHDALITGAWAVVVVAVVIALTRGTEPHWPLAVTAGAFSVLVFLSEIVDNLSIVQPRYVIAPALLLYVAIVAMFRPRGLAADGAAPGGPWSAAARWCPVAVFAVALAVVCAVNFRVTNGRSQSPPWTTVVAQASTSCQRPGVTSYRYAHAWWWVEIPCSRVGR